MFPFDTPLKQWKNHRLSDAFSGNKVGTLAENGLV